METKDNIVSVTGTLDTSLQVERIIEIAASFDNVKDVISHLKVKNSNTPLTDTLITAKVKGKILNLFLNKKMADGYDLHVETTDKKVHVFGNVVLESDIETIKNAVTSVKEVGSIENNITVKVK